MNSRCFKGILGIIVLLLIVSLSALGCGSGGTDSPVTTAAGPTGMTVGAYKAEVATIFTDLESAGSTAATAISDAAGQAGSETAAGLAQAELIQQAAAQWATAIVGAQTTLGAITPPDAAATVQADLTSFLGEYKASIDQLAGKAAYTAGIIAAYSELEAATLEGGPIAALDALAASDPEDMAGRLSLSQNVKAVLDNFAAQLQTLTVPDGFAEIHATIVADVATTLQTADQVLQTLTGLVESDSQEARDQYNTLSDQFSAQWKTVEQDFTSWQSVQDAAQTEWIQGQDAFATRLTELSLAIDSL
jgi:hypothetical protein